MTYPTFKGVRLIVPDSQERVLRAILPESLHRDFDTARSRYRDMRPVALGGVLHLEQGLSWGVEYRNGDVIVWVVSPLLNMSYQEVLVFENRHSLRGHPIILFLPVHQDRDMRVGMLIGRNIRDRLPWDTGLGDVS